MSTKGFFQRRYSNLSWFALPIILACVAIGLLGNYLDHHSKLPTETVSGILIILITALMVITAFVIFTKKKLGGIFGAWQKKWHKIPRWRDQLQKYKKEGKK